MAVKLWAFLMLSSASQRAENRSKIRGVLVSPLQPLILQLPECHGTSFVQPRTCSGWTMRLCDCHWPADCGKCRRGGKKKNARHLAHPGAEAAEAAVSSSSSSGSRDVRTDRGGMSLSWHRQKDVPGSFLCTAGGFPRGRGVVDGQAVPGSRLSEGSVRDRTPDVGRAAEI